MNTVAQFNISNILNNQYKIIPQDILTMWRDLLFYIKKGANWSFPLGVEGIKSDFYKVHV